MRKGRKTALFFYLWFLSFSGMSSATEVRVLTIKEALDLAIRANRRIFMAKSERDSRGYAEVSAALDFAPRVDLRTEMTRVDSRSFEVANEAKVGLEELIFNVTQSRIDIEPFLFRTTYRTVVNIVQPVYNGGRLWANLSIARAMERNAREKLRGEKQEIVFQVQAAYLDALKAQRTVEVQRDAVEAANQWVGHMEKQFEVGVRNRREVLRWEVQLASSELSLTRAENRLTIAKARLKKLLGLEITDAIELVDIESEDELPFPVEQGSFEEALEEMLSRHPALRATDALVSTSRQGVKMARSNFLPSINLMFSYGWHIDDDLHLDDYNIWSASVSISYPLMDALSRGMAEYKRSRADLLRAEMEREDLEEELKLVLLSTWRTIESSRKNLSLARKAEEHAQENLRIVEDQFKLGMVENVVLLDAQVSYDRTRIELVAANYDYYKALAALLRATGEPVRAMEGVR